MVAETDLRLDADQKRAVRQLLRQWSREALTGVLPTPCQLWQGAQRREGVGAIRVGPLGMQDVHRLALAACLEVLPAGVLVRHKCHCSLCVNPEHLHTGTDLDNNLDAIRAGNRLTKKSLTRQLRRRIAALTQAGVSSRDIAGLLQLPRTTVRDEIRRVRARASREALVLNSVEGD